MAERGADHSWHFRKWTVELDLEALIDEEDDSKIMDDNGWTRKLTYLVANEIHFHVNLSMLAFSQHISNSTSTDASAGVKTLFSICQWLWRT